MAEVEKDRVIDVDKPDTRGDAEEFKRLQRECYLYRIYFCHPVVKQEGVAIVTIGF